MKSKLSISFGILGILILLFILIPLANLILSATFNTEIFIKYLTDKDVLNSIFLSFFCAFLATLIAFIFGVPLAYILARKNFYGKSFVEGIVDVPVVVPHTVAGIALLSVFSSNGLIGGFFFENFSIKFVDALPGIIIAMLFVSVPFMINYSREGFESIDIKLENAARTLGANPFYVFLKISFPLAFRNIFVGAIMTWARAVSEFGAVIMMAYYPMIATTLIYDKFLTEGIYASQAVAAILLIFCLIVFVILRLLIKKEKE